MLFIDVKVKRVIWILRVMRVAAQGLLPGDDLADVLEDLLAFCQVCQCKNTFTVHTRAARLDTAVVGDWGAK